MARVAPAFTEQYLQHWKLLTDFRAGLRPGRVSFWSDEIPMTGARLETHPSFPRKTNVQFLQVLDRKNIRIEIWERGAGYTLASGSSSSASAAVARKLGRVDHAVTVHMPGGTLGIEIGEDYAIRMTGPVTKVSEGVVAAEMLK